MNHTDGAIHRSGEQWTPSRSATLTISVIDRPQKQAPPGARKVPFGFGLRDEPVAEPAAESGSEAPVAEGWQGNPS
jgi:hypothetical protein